MKPLRLLAFIGMACMLSCSRPTPETAIAVLFDRTDTMQRYPSATELVSPFVQQDMWQAMHVTLNAISDKDVNDTHIFSLPAADPLLDNTMMRQARISHFTGQIQAVINTMHAGTCGHSIVYRAIAAQANALAALQANSKVLVICSDLAEHDSLSFYDPRTLALLKTRPDSIEHILTRQHRLTDLTGVDVWLVYSPRSYNDNNAYMPVAHFYERLFTAHGATVHIATSFSPL